MITISRTNWLLRLACYGGLNTWRTVTVCAIFWRAVLGSLRALLYPGAIAFGAAVIGLLGHLFFTFLFILIDGSEHRALPTAILLAEGVLGAVIYTAWCDIKGRRNVITKVLLPRIEGALEGIQYRQTARLIAAAWRGFKDKTCLLVRVED